MGSYPPRPEALIKGLDREHLVISQLKAPGLSTNSHCLWRKSSNLWRSITSLGNSSWTSNFKVLSLYVPLSCYIEKALCQETLYKISKSCLTPKSQHHSPPPSLPPTHPHKTKIQLYFQPNLWGSVVFKRFLPSSITFLHTPYPKSIRFIWWDV